MIKYDLEYLSLCPCLVDVEITDVKAGNSSLLVATGWEFCTCGKDPRAGGGGPAGGRPHMQGTSAKVGGWVCVGTWPDLVFVC